MLIVCDFRIATCSTAYVIAIMTHTYLAARYVRAVCACVQVEYKQRIAAAGNERSEEVERLKAEISQFDAKQESAMASYKEQIRQHSVTICAMEERLNKVVKKNKDFQAEIGNYKATISGNIDV